jgi:hypothetical protein
MYLECDELVICSIDLFMNCLMMNHFGYDLIETEDEYVIPLIFFATEQCKFDMSKLSSPLKITLLHLHPSWICKLINPKSAIEPKIIQDIHTIWFDYIDFSQELQSKNYRMMFIYSQNALEIDYLKINGITRIPMYVKNICDYVVYAYSLTPDIVKEIDIMNLLAPGNHKDINIESLDYKINENVGHSMVLVKDDIYNIFDGQIVDYSMVLVKDDIYNIFDGQIVLNNYLFG